MNQRRILVTGSSRGIGKAIALRLAGEGFAVTIHCRNRLEEAAAVAKAIIDAGGQADLTSFDVRDRTAATEASSTTRPPWRSRTMGITSGCRTL